jgi:hypothetical protein
MVIVHNLFLLFELIMFASISFLKGLFLEVLFVATRVTVAAIIVVTTIVLVFVAIVLVALVMVISLATMMPVVWTTAANDRRMSHFLPFGCFFSLACQGYRFVRSLALLEKGHKPKRVHRHHFVHLCKLTLMHLWLH